MSRKNVAVTARIYGWQKALLKSQNVTAADVISYYCEARFRDKKTLSLKKKLLNDELTQLELDKIMIEQQIDEVEKQLLLVDNDTDDEFVDRDKWIHNCISALHNIVVTKKIDVDHAKILPDFIDVVNFSAQQLGEDNKLFFDEVVELYESGNFDFGGDVFVEI